MTKASLDPDASVASSATRTEPGRTIIHRRIEEAPFSPRSPPPTPLCMGLIGQEGGLKTDRRWPPDQYGRHRGREGVVRSSSWHRRLPTGARVLPASRIPRNVIYESTRLWRWSSLFVIALISVISGLMPAGLTRRKSNYFNEMTCTYVE